jgi:large subunit ribosomal protein L3
MIKAILGEKLGMSQIFDKEGKPVPVTVIKAGPCYITGIKTQENDGYEAVQLGFGQAKRLTKPEEGRLKKAKIKEKLKYFREFKIEDIEVLKNLKLGEKIDVSVFQEGDKVMVSGISKGKGFAGVIKRHGFSRGPETHGSDHHRRPGSIGSMFPQRVIKGRKMPGHMGAERITVKGLKVAKVLPETDILLIKGAIPGPKKGLIEIRGI